MWYNIRILENIRLLIGYYVAESVVMQNSQRTLITTTTCAVFFDYQSRETAPLESVVKNKDLNMHIM